MKLLVGSYGGKTSSLKTATPLLMMDIKLDGTVMLTIPGDHFIGVYVLEGSGEIGGQELGTYSVATSKAKDSTPGDTQLQCTGEMRFLVFSGAPIREPICVDGYFTCCTEEETKRAVEDFDERKGNFSLGATWTSKIGKS